MKYRVAVAIVLILAVNAARPTVVLGQNAAGAQTPNNQTGEATPPPPVYKPPMRGAPGGRVGGASRTAVRISTPLPVIELLAPADHAGLTATANPVLLFSVSRPVAWPMQFTISAPLQPAPIIETTIPSPSAAGIYALRVGDFRVRLQPGIIYTWSVSVVLDSHAWSRNIAASATIVYDPTADISAARIAAPLWRATVFAGAGLWYDAVAAAADAQHLDRHAALDALIRQVGLSAAPGYAQSVTAGQ